MMNHRWCKAGLVWSLVALSGCSSLKSMNPFKDAPRSSSSSSSSNVTAFVEPQTRESTGLNRVWRESVGRSPGKHQQQPGQFVVSGADLFVGTFQGRVVRMDRQRGRILWDVTVGERVSGGVAVDGQQLYVGTRAGEMVALGRESGKELWRTPLSAPVTSAPAVGEGRVVFLTLDNRTYGLSSEDGKRIWSHSTPPELLVIMGAATPTVDGRVVYVGYSSGDLFALSLESGAPLWTENLSLAGGRTELDLLQSIQASVVLSPEGDTVASGMKKLFAVNHQGRAVAILPRNGARVWERKLSSIRRPWLAGKQLFFADTEGYMVALSAIDGLELWRTRVSDGLLSGPVGIGDKVLVADDRGRLITLDGASGRVLGMDRLGEAVLADPVVVDNSVFLWTNEGNVLRYDF
ncbi:MAG: outer membrane protein assembly factor BamB [Magnetococcus sp. MYC-9]